MKSDEKWHKWVGTTVAVTVLALVAAPARSDDATSRLSVFVSIGPQKFLAEKIGGEHVAVTLLLPPGQSPATYDPTPKQLAALAEADVYFRIGVPFERQVVAKVAATFEELDVVNTGTDSGEEQAERDPGEHAHGHDHHDHGHAHDHGEVDPHIWTSPRLAKDIAAAIHAAFCRHDPEHKGDYGANLAALTAELNELDGRIAKMLKPHRGRSFFVFHPAFGHFAEAYGIRQVAIESGGKSPVAKQLGRLIAQAKKDDVRVILVQPQFDRSSADLIAREIGGSVVVVDPLSEDYPGMILHLAAVLRDALAGKSDKASGG